MRLIESKDVINDAVTRGLAFLAGFKRGDTVPYAALDAVAGFDRDSPHWGSFRRRVGRDLLNTRGILIRPVPNVGWRLLDKDAHVLDLTRPKKAGRQMTRQIIELSALPDKELSDHQRNVKHRKLDLAKSGRRAVRYTTRVGHMLARPRVPDLPRPRPTA